jgi:hypothetical protein
MTRSLPAKTRIRKVTRRSLPVRKRRKKAINQLVTRNPLSLKKQAILLLKKLQTILRVKRALRRTLPLMHQNLTILSEIYLLLAANLKCLPLHLEDNRCSRHLVLSLAILGILTLKPIRWIPFSRNSASSTTKSSDTSATPAKN